jgi:hypothetical protein
MADKVAFLNVTLIQQIECLLKLAPSLSILVDHF